MTKFALLYVGEKNEIRELRFIIELYRRADAHTKKVVLLVLWQTATDAELNQIDAYVQKYGGSLFPFP